jgi:hypothetical protein
MEHNRIFINQKVQALYDLCYTEPIAKLNSTIEICNIFLPLVQLILDDPDAYNEAKTWNDFYGVIEQNENKTKLYPAMDFNSSMCFSLWSYIYH